MQHFDQLRTFIVEQCGWKSKPLLDVQGLKLYFGMLFIVVYSKRSMFFHENKVESRLRFLVMKHPDWK